MLEKYVTLLSLAVSLIFYPAKAQSTAKQSLQLAGLQQTVTVIRDRYFIPHIFAKTPHDAYFVLGYLHASDRLLEMDFLRRRAKGELAEILGPDLFQSDLLMRQIGIRRTAEAVWQSDKLDPWIRETLQAYSDGVNAKLAKISQKEFAKIFGVQGYIMPKWTPVDAIAFVKYMGWDQSGTDDDLWFGLVRDKVGAETFNELWPIDRPFETPIVPYYDSPKLPRKKLGKVRMTPALKRAFGEIFGLFGAQVDLFRYPGSFGSNNWTLDGSKSITGKPMLASDPHLGFQLPSLWYEAHLVAAGLNVTGVTFPGVPYIIIGHNSHIAWGITNMQSDAVDFFIETFAQKDSTLYLHKKVWKHTKIITETIRIAGKKPRKVHIPYTVHGPVLNRKGRKIAMQWTGLEPTFELVALAKFNIAKNLKDFKKALSFLGVPAINIAYADIDGNIAIAPHGNLPIRKRGLGRIPHDGASGDYDWIGLIPREELPFAVNPPEHYLTSANQRPAPAGYPHYLGWMWDPGYRARRIHSLLRSKEKISLADMKRFQYDVFSLPASIFVPILIQAYDRKPFGEQMTKKCIEILRQWDFQMLPESPAPVIWTIWFESYRSAVWQDDFEALNIPKAKGSWGYTGDNRREPVLEVLEYLTRYNPQSPWFDDKSTPEVETRDDIFAKSFLAAIERLKGLSSQLGSADPARWQWGKTHKLSIESITRLPALGRKGIPIRGGRFTVNPGGGLFGTGGGASWRMIVDFSNFNQSVGIYPGGQLADSGSPHYDDQLPLWVRGRYIPLYFYENPDAFPGNAVQETLMIQPQ